jgi:hypothetical protein
MELEEAIQKVNRVCKWFALFSERTAWKVIRAKLSEVQKPSDNNRSDEIAWLETVLKTSDVNCNNARNSYFFIKQKINDRISQLRAMR